MDAALTFDVLLFDLGGVLIDFAGFEEMSRLVPGCPDRSEIRSRWIESVSVQQFERGRITRDQFADGVVRELALPLSPGEFLHLFVEWVRGPYPGARSLLQKLKTGHRLACLSNSNELHTEIHRRSMGSLFENFYFSDEIGAVKPDRKIFEHVVHDLETSPEKILFFDDTPINIEAAREFGIIAYQVDGIAQLSAKLQQLKLLPGRE